MYNNQDAEACEDHPSSAEEYLKYKMSKPNRKHREDKLSDLIDYITKLYKHEHLTEMEMEGKDTVPRIIQRP